MEISEKWLGEIGGWQAMKAARSLVAAGKVQMLERTLDTVRGHVGGEKSRISAGLKIRSRTDVENLCTCMLSRRTGQICDHSLAVALASIAPAKPSASGPGPATPPRAQASGNKQAPAVHPLTVPAQLSLFLPESLLATTSDSVGSATGFLKVEPGLQESSKLAAWLSSRGVPLQNCPLALTRADLHSLLGAAADHPRLFAGKPGSGLHRPLTVLEAPLRPLLRISAPEQQGESRKWVSLEIIEKPAPRLLRLAGGEPNWLFHEGTGTLHPWQPDPAANVTELTRELLSGRGTQPSVQRPLRWLAENLSQIEINYQVELDSWLSNRYKTVPAPVEFHFEVDGSMQAIQITVRARFHQLSWLITENVSAFPIEDESTIGLFYTRNIKAEKAVFDSLSALGFALDTKTGRFELRGEREVLSFYASHLKRFEANHCVKKSERWERATRGLLRIAPLVRNVETDARNEVRGPGADWLSMEFAYSAPDGFQLSRAEALRMIRSGQNVARDRSGRRYVLDLAQCEEFEESLQDVPVQLTADGMRIQAAHQDYFRPYAERAKLAATRDEVIDIEGWRRKLGPLGETLRPYQLEGVGWLAQRLEAGQGALLGDDMGLGKTLQSIAIIRHLLKRSPPGTQTLVISPKSLVTNWLAEFQRFAPDLKVLVMQGSKRQEFQDSFCDYNVIITSYGLISRDLELYKTTRFALGVVDEASFLRNPDTETARAVRQLNFGARLALTGTPVENGVRDLWSIFEVVLPGYLGTRQSFQERFEKPMKSSSHPESINAASRLRRLIRPFYLRRTKKEVLKDLPEKIEQVFWCEMSPAQSEIYRRILEEGREEVRAARRRSGQGGARMTMLTVLLRLRQVCCDIRLAGLDREKIEGLPADELSGKWPALDQRLDEVLAGGGKALIFSQFVSYLASCREHLRARGIDFCYLDGSTEDRASVVTEFQSNPSKSVFLISLKAGGYGLNLTAADHVLLMDPWWNPAVESQAIDRAHRYGQNRAVTAFRLVMRGTVEERVLALQERKRGLISATVEERAPLMEGLTDGDLEELLG